MRYREMNRRFTCISLATLFFVLSLHDAPAAVPQPDIPLLLEIWLNGNTKHIITEAVQRQNILLIDAMTLESAGLKFNLDEIRPDGFIGINSLTGVKMELINSEQRLDITAPPDRLEAQKFDLRPDAKAKATTSGNGFLGQYDIVSTVDNFSQMNESSTIGATLGGTYFTPQGNLTVSGFTQTTNAVTQTVRLDTNIEQDTPGTMERFVAGDAITGSQNWSRSVRFGGFQIATDFMLRPDLSTLPLPAFFGQTAVPASVDIFVNSARVFETNVDPGPFQINNLPVITGSGDASVVVHNALGQDTVVTLPFFASSMLLRPGLASYDIDVGFLRTGYGQQSFGYSDPVATGNYNIGETNWLTLESHGELAREVQLAGAGAAFSISPYGAVNIASAVSNSDTQAHGNYGALNSISFETQTAPVGFFGSLNTTSGAYSDIASIGSAPPPDVQMQVGAHIGLEDSGALAVSLIGIERARQRTSRLATGSYTLSIGQRCSLGVTGFYDRTNHDTVVQGFLSIAIGNGLIGNSNVNTGNHTHEVEADVTKPVNPDGGLGYRLSTSRGDDTIEQANMTWMEQHGEIDAAFESRNGSQAAQINASGGVVIMDGEIYTTPRPDGSVALVETGEPGTAIYRENRQVATTDDNGKALLTGLVPFTENRISIDPSHYKFSTIVDVMDKSVTPGRASGVLVDFTPTPHFPAVVTLTLDNGDYPPAGSPVTLGGITDPLVVGRRGEVFIADLRIPMEGTVIYDNGSCHFSVAPLPVTADDVIPRIGPITCSTQPGMP